MSAATGGAAASVALALAATDVDGCPAATDAAVSTNDISLVEKLHLQPSQRGTAISSGQHRRRRSGSGTKCIWPTTDWLRKLRNQKARETEQSSEQDIELGKSSINRRSSVLLMVLLSSSDEVKAKAVLVSEQPPSPADEDVEDAIDALWL